VEADSSGRLFLVSAGQNCPVRDIFRDTVLRLRCQRDPSRLWQQREASDADPVWLDHRDAAGGQRVGQHGQIRAQQPDLLVRSPLGSPPEQDDRRTIAPPAGQQGAEVGVGRNDDPVLSCRTVEDLVVAGGPKRGVPNMHRVVTATDNCSATHGDNALSIRNFNPQLRAAVHAHEPLRTRIGAPRRCPRAQGLGTRP